MGRGIEGIQTNLPGKLWVCLVKVWLRQELLEILYFFFFFFSIGAFSLSNFLTLRLVDVFIIRVEVEGVKRIAKFMLV